MSTAQEFVDDMNSADVIFSRIMWCLCGICVISIVGSGLLLYIHF